jgi:DNA-binding NtrC family response regulator
VLWSDGPKEHKGTESKERSCIVNLETQIGKANDRTTLPPGLKQNGPPEVRILIVSGNDPIAERLAKALSEADFAWERAGSITAGCESARSGRFQVILTTPLMGDGSWRRLVDLAGHYESGFAVILLATTFDIQEWTEALEYGAFDVLDALHELPRVAESVTSAAWAAYLRGAVQRTEAMGPPRAA